MCGFFVEFRTKDIFFDKKKFKTSSKLLSHRGPDQNQSIYLKNISMEFYRLSIRDLSINGNQPMWDASKRFVIVFNGEIYNTDELKNRINKKILKGNSDTEILINLYSKYKTKILDLIDGMYSFVIYDTLKNSCFVARDRFGIKPLYYSIINNKIVISSELKPILKYIKNISFNNSAFENLFINGYLDNNHYTFFKHVHSLEPGTYFEKNSKNIKFKKYWDIKNTINQNNKKKNLKYLLEQSIQKHLLSDREIGLFLSGGTDSSIILELVNKYLNYKIKTFTYDFKGSGAFGESTLAKKISSKYKLENYTEIITPKYIVNNFEKLIEKLESPFTSIRLFGTDKLYKSSVKKKINVIIEGHGGDEMIGGYGYNLFPYLIDKSKPNILNFEKKILETYNNMKNKKFSVNQYKFTLFNQGLSTTDGMPFFNRDILNKRIKKDYKKITKLILKYGCLKYSQIQDIENIKIPRVLKYSDKISMSYGIETRVPLLDSKLFSYCFNLPNNKKFYKDSSRYIIKQNFINKKIFNFFSKNKKSIVDPQNSWLKSSLKDYLMDNINTSGLKEIEILNSKEVKKYCQDFIKGKISSSFLIFTILTSIKFINYFKKY